jgi:hypothetical protein
MKLRNLALFLVLGTMPALALAQTPQPGPNPAMRAHMQAFRQFHAQAEQEWRATRARMLAALSAEHRLMVAHIVGMLAISPRPDLRAAARQIDAILTPAERSAILADAQAEHAQMRAEMQQMRAQMMQAHSQMMQAHTQMMQAHEGMEHGNREHHAPTAGGALLHNLIPGHGPMPGMMLMMHAHGAAPAPQQP